MWWVRVFRSSVLYSLVDYLGATDDMFTEGEEVVFGWLARGPSRHTSMLIVADTTKPLSRMAKSYLSYGLDRRSKPTNLWMR